MALKKKGKKLKSATTDDKKVKKGKKLKIKKGKKSAAADEGWPEDDAPLKKVKKGKKIKAGKVSAKTVDDEWVDPPSEGKSKKLKKGKKVKGEKAAKPDKVKKGKKMSKTSDGEDKPARDPISVAIADGGAKIRIRGSADLELPKYEETDSPFGKIYTAAGGGDDAPSFLVNVTAATKTILMVSIFKVVEAGGPLVKVLVRKVPAKTAADVIIKFLYKGLEIKPPRKSKAKKAKPAKAAKAAKKGKAAKKAKPAKDKKAAKKGKAKPAKKAAKGKKAKKK